MATWTYVLLSFGALLASRTVKASESASGLENVQEFSLKVTPTSIADQMQSGTHIRLDSTRYGQTLTEAQLIDILSEDDGDGLMDQHTVLDANKALVGRKRYTPFRLRMPFSFQAPIGTQRETPQFDLVKAWTQQSIQDFETRLQQRFGRNSKPQFLSTGTTIAGVCGLCDGRPFVVLGADTRATAGRMVADKRCSKIHPLASNMWACGAGTSADLDQITRHCRYALAMQNLVEFESIGNSPRKWAPEEEEDVDPNLETPARHAITMTAACRFFRDTLYRGGGTIGANLIVGGIDEGTGQPHIRAIHPHGSMDVIPYAALGSGGLAAMAVIESRYKGNITPEEGIQIVKEAILAGIQNDMGSGSQVDLCVITTTEPISPTSEEGQYIRVVSNHTRAFLPEEQVPGLPAIKPSEPKDTKDSSSIPGVNGFGRYPYSIRSKRVVIQSRDAEEENRMKQWDGLLWKQRQ